MNELASYCIGRKFKKDGRYAVLFVAGWVSSGIKRW